VRTADLLLHVIDASSPLADERIEIVDRVLEEIGAGATPRIIVLNKADLLANPPRVPHGFDTVTVSALRREGLERLLGEVARNFGGLREEVRVTLPAARGDLIAMARRDGEVVSEEYRDGVVSMRAFVGAAVAGRLRKASVNA
jgi:GTP-binding protein HflX